MLQIPLNNVQIRNQTMHNIPPRPIQRLIPNTRPIRPHRPHKTLTPRFYRVRLSLEDAVAMLGLHEIHFVHEREDVGARGVFLEGFDDGGVGDEVAVVVTLAAVKLEGLDVKNIDEDADVGEHVGFLGGEVIFGESVLSVLVWDGECLFKSNGKSNGILTHHSPTS